MSEMLQNQSRPNLSSFRPEFCTKSCSEVFPIWTFRMLVSWETETTENSPKLQVRRNSLNTKFLGRIQKLYASGPFFCCFRQGVAGMCRDLGRDVPDLEKLYARKLWADFSHPKTSPAFFNAKSPGKSEEETHESSRGRAGTVSMVQIPVFKRVAVLRGLMLGT